MMTVRSPQGLSVVFNSAGFVARGAHGYTDIYESKGADGQHKGWLAQVPNDWLIEAVRPCRVYNAMHQPAELGKAVLEAINNRELPSYETAKIKIALQGFDARKRRWK